MAGSSNTGAASTAPETAPMERRDRIIQVATRQFAAKGFAAVRIDEIAKESRCNKQLIYYYFTNKVGVWEAALTRLIEGNAAAWQRLPGSTFKDLLLRQRGEIPLDPPTEEAALWGQLLMREGVDYVDVESTPIHLRGARTKTWAVQTETIRAAQDRGEVRADLDPEMLSYFVALTRSTGRILPQVAQMITGEELGDSAFRERWKTFLAQIAEALKP